MYNKTQVKSREKKLLRKEIYVKRKCVRVVRIRKREAFYVLFDLKQEPPFTLAKKIYVVNVNDGTLYFPKSITRYYNIRLYMICQYSVIRFGIIYEEILLFGGMR